MPSAYLAGPMRHKPHSNFPAFFKAERKLRKLGWTVCNPARMDVFAGDTTKDGKCLFKLTPGSLRRLAKRDLGVIMKLRAEDGDAVIMLPGWRKSMGARAENAVARWLGLKRLTIRQVLR